jgi:hypothetical protein
MATMYGGGGGKVARAEKRENKKVAKEAAKTVKSVVKSMAEKPSKSSSTSGSKPMVRDLSSLDKFDKRIKLRQVPKEDKASAKAYNQRLKEKRKGK